MSDDLEFESSLPPPKDGAPKPTEEPRPEFGFVSSILPLELPLVEPKEDDDPTGLCEALGLELLDVAPNPS